MAARIDEIKQLPDAVIALKSKGNSYVVEASVPLKEIGLNPATTGWTLRGDVGVIYSDTTGSNRSLRLYYYNKKTNITSDLSTEATLQPAEWGPIQLSLGKNLLENGGFEYPLASNAEKGWHQTIAKNGAVVRLGNDSPHSGTQDLTFTQTKPAAFSATAFAAAQEREFIQSANNGAGGGEATVEQRVPVIARHLYAFRFNYRSDGMRSEQKAPGLGRGYSSLRANLEWNGANVQNDHKVFTAMDTKADSFDWVARTNSSQRYVLLPKPYKAPDGATSVTISFSLTTLTADDLPNAAVDDVEFVDVTP
jgi:hypothetical protein